MDRTLKLQVVFSALDKLSGTMKALGSSSKQLTGQIAAARQEVSRLEQAQKQVAGFRQLKRSIADTKKEMQEAQERATRLGRELAQTEQPTAKLRKEFKAASREAEKLEQRFQQTSQKLNAARTSLNDAGISTRDLARHERDLASQLKAANDRIDQQKKRVGELAKAQQRAHDIKALGGKASMAGGVATATVTAPLIAIGSSAFEAAMNMQELESAFAVTFGRSAPQMRKWAAGTGDVLERKTSELMQMSMSYMDVLRQSMPTGQAEQLSRELTVLAQDLGSFKNLPNDVAFQKIFSGIIGESEPLRAVGVMLSENAVQAKALEMGLKPVNGELTEGAKIAARAALIQEQLANASGDILRTSESPANRLKALDTAAEDLNLTLGQKLLPKLAPIIDKVAALLDHFSNLPPGMQEFIVWAAIIAAVLGPVIVVIGGLISAFGAIAAATAAFTAPIWGVVAAIVLLIAILGGAVVYIVTHWEEIKAAFGDGIAWIKQQFGALPAWFKSIGGHVMAGLLSFLTPGPFVQRLLVIAKSGIAAFKNFFGIKSPSRLFMAMGGYLTEGLSRGIDRGGRRPLAAIGKLASGVAAAGAMALSPTVTTATALPAMPQVVRAQTLASAETSKRAAPDATAAPTASPASTSWRDLIFNIYQQPGEDVEALARRIERILDRRNATAARGAYVDRGD